MQQIPEVLIGSMKQKSSKSYSNNSWWINRVKALHINTNTLVQ